LVLCVLTVRMGRNRVGASMRLPPLGRVTRSLGSARRGGSFRPGVRALGAAARVSRMDWRGGRLLRVVFRFGLWVVWGVRGVRSGWVIRSGEHRVAQELLDGIFSWALVPVVALPCVPHRLESGAVVS